MQRRGHYRLSLVGHRREYRCHKPGGEARLGQGVRDRGVRLMPALTITLLEPGVTLQTLGALPDMLDAADPAPAREQLDRGYRDRGGFRALSGWYLGADDVLHFPGDRPYRPIAETRLGSERILVFECNFVAVVQPDRSFEVARMD